jgi:hypothetical protein
MEAAMLMFASLLLNALASGVVFSHVLERPGKLALASGVVRRVHVLFRRARLDRMADAANPFATTHADALQVHPRG